MLLTVPRRGCIRLQVCVSVIPVMAIAEFVNGYLAHVLMFGFLLEAWGPVRSPYFPPYFLAMLTV